MKARIKATGKIVDVVKNSFTTEIYDINGVKRTLDCTIYLGEKKNYHEDELEFDVDYDPDYWTRLEHQAAIAAMQGALANNDLLMQLLKRAKSGSRITHIAVEFANACAHTFVEKLKEKEER